MNILKNNQHPAILLHYQYAILDLTKISYWKILYKQNFHQCILPLKLISSKIKMASSDGSKHTEVNIYLVKNLIAFISSLPLVANHGWKICLDQLHQTLASPLYPQNAYHLSGNMRR